MGVKEESKKIAKHTSIYGLGGVLGRLIGFLMLPVYTRFLTPADYGALELVGITTGILGTIISVGIASAMFRFYYEYEDPQERNEVISTGVIAFASFALISIFILSLGSNQFASLILGSPQYSSYFLVSFATLWFSTLVRMGMDYLRIREWSTIYLATSLANLVLSLSLNIYFVVIAKKAVMGILLSGLISSIVFAAVLVIPLLVNVGVHFSMPKCREMLKFGAPLIISDVGRSIANKSDRYFVRGFGTLDATGIYSLGYKFGTMVHTFVTSPFLQIWFPRRLASYKEADAEETFSRIFTYFLFVLTLVGLGISVVIKDVIHIVTTPAFYEAYKVVPLIVFAYIIFSFYYHFSMALFITKKTKHLAAIDTATGAANIVLNYFLIKYYLVWGAVAATILSFALRVTLTYIIGGKVYPIKMEKLRVAQLFVSAGAAYWLSTFVELGTPWLNIPCKGLFVLVFVGILWGTGFLRDGEAAALRQAWSGIHARVFLRA